MESKFDGGVDLRWQYASKSIEQTTNGETEELEEPDELVISSL